MTPARFTGLWRRVSVAVGEQQPDERASVHWLQAGDRFVDLRRPLDGQSALSGPRAFGGTTAWRAPVLTWHHELDSRPGPSADEGHITWDGDGRLTERGVVAVAGETLPYVEVWERQTPAGPADGRAWSPAPGALAVEVAGHRMAITVTEGGRWAGGLWASRDGGWALADRAGDAYVLAGLYDILLAAS